ncbi:unnamed protein product [Brassicogethes aeneus]|uniref:Torsin-1A C-terminal domain-containing protein n=1 Tax=Brassicogethes aeneus TaxID=1431903 RepID=A0A9P0BAI8_BRAAE|nr:unnamed protein product [Brassicogethes aeneus]
MSFIYSKFQSIFSLDTYTGGVRDIVEFAICSAKECCYDNYIPANFDGLEKTLNKKVYGQHLVHIAVDALRPHWNKDFRAKKALTLSFHGWPGGGKNYVSKFIAENLFANGIKSRFVHNFIGRLHFPRDDHIEQYKHDLYNWIKGNTSNCPKQLFIFDEVDKMPAQLLNAIKPIIDYKDFVEGVDYRQTIFIFLSNTGQSLINELYINFWENGKKREDLKLKDFENLIMKGAFNEQGGFHQSDTIKSNLIDHYIPFLPMEKSHVMLCIKDEFIQRGIYEPQQDHINEIMESMDWGPKDLNLFSKTGCKRVSQKVSVTVARFYRSKKTEL